MYTSTMRLRFTSLLTALPPVAAFTRHVRATSGVPPTYGRPFCTRAMASTATAPAPASISGSTEEARLFVNAVNSDYEELHRAFEMQFWGTKMALGDASYSVMELTRTKGAMEGFLADDAKLAKVRELLSVLPEDDPTTVTLRMLERTFKCYIMESQEARALRSAATAIEGNLEGERNELVLGATIGGRFEEMSSVELRSRLRVDPDGAVRRACYDGLTKIGDFVVENGFVELVRTRNAMAKTLGYQDYYDYKVTQAEGFGKDALFVILDRLEEGTRPIMEAARARFADEKGGAEALEPWNSSFLMAGDVTRKMDPYFPFEKAIEQWGRSFAAMNIAYRGATMDLDLLDRKRKYSNGFCHWPQPAWVRPDGSLQPATTHFTSLADPSAVGSGMTGLTTLMHEAGHAAHFANIAMPSPLFAQERAPTSVAYAELQSMFLDALVGDAAWRAKYAISRDGEPLPWNLVQEDLEASHPYKVFGLRGMIAVSYFEKALYEMADGDVSAESIKALADEVELKIQGGPSARPLLSVPHLLSDEASCYYHGYVLAEMGVHQTREFFLERDGFVVDNPKIGPTLAKNFWRPGNSEPFLDLVQKCTGRPLSGEAWIAALRRDVGELVDAEKEAYENARAEAEGSVPTEEIDLDMRISIVDGDDVLADTAEDGSFLATCAKFEKYVRERYSQPV